MTSPITPPSTPEAVEQLNDQLAREHPIDEYYQRSPFVIRFIQARRLSIIKRMTASRPGLKIIEVGSGGGHVLRMFPEAKLTAVDVSQVYLDTARKNLAGYDVEFCKGELSGLNFEQGSFDRVICTEVLEHTTDPGEVLSQIRRLLRTDGRAVITVPVDPLINRIKTIVRYTPVGWLLGNRVNWGGDHYHLHTWWPWQFERLLREDFVVTDRAAAPAWAMPLHACFACRPR